MELEWHFFASFEMIFREIAEVESVTWVVS